jgi:hypothetical protein
MSDHTETIKARLREDTFGDYVLLPAVHDAIDSAFVAGLQKHDGGLPQDEFDGAGCCPEEDGFLRAKARAAATPPLHGTGYCPQPCPECAAATPDPPEPCEKCRVWSSHCPRCAAATPDPPPCRCPDDWRYDDGSVSCPRHPTKPDAPAASPDERLREAVAALPQYVITIQDREGYTYERGCEGQPINYTGVMLADVEALVGKLKDGATTARETTNELKDAAADREKPEGCRAPHCFSEYGTPCGTCPAEKPETP